MSGTTEILQEYLVKLGFQTDAVSFRKFESTLGGIGSKVFGIGSAVASMTIAVEAGVAAFAAKMTKLYWSSEIAGSSVRNLRAISFAAEQVGVSGDAMQGFVETLKRSTRLNPGMMGLVDNLTGLKEEGKDTTLVVLDLLTALKKQPEFVGAKWAEQLLGMDPDSYHLLINHLDEVKAKVKEMQDQIGNDAAQQKAAKVLKDYSNQLKLVESEAETAGISIAAALEPAFLELNKGVSDSLKELDYFFGDGLQQALKESHGFVDFVKHWFTEGIQHSIDISEGKTESAAEGMQHSIDISEGKTESADKAYSSMTMRLLQGMGWSKIDAAGITANLIRESGVNPYQYGDNGKAYGIAQWHADRQADFKRWSGHDIRASTLKEQLQFLTYEMTKGKEQKAGNLLRGANSATEAGRLVSEYYERPAATESESALRGTLAARLGGTTNHISVVQNNNINVTGSNAQEIGKSVVELTNRKYGDTFRNYVARVQ